MLHNSDVRQAQAGLSPVGLASADDSAIDISDLSVGAMVEVETGHTTYHLENRGDGKVLISGHPEYCPEPVLVDFQGSVGGGALLKMWRIEPGLKMAFEHPKFGVVRTSRVRSIRQLAPSGAPSVS